MKTTKILKRIGWVLLSISLVQTQLLAQRKRPAAKPPAPAQPIQAAPTFDTILAADSYKVYGEVRGIGQLLRSAGVNDVLDPVMKLAAPPKEFKTLVKWLNSQADVLMTSRMMFAAWPSRPKLPQVLFAIEFDSPEEAQKFEPRLKEFLPRFLPTPAPESSPSTNDEKQTPTQKVDPVSRESAPAKPQYILKQIGTLVCISDTPFTFKSLRPKGSKLLGEDQNFRRVHDRFTTESIFVYVDVNSLEREQEERRQKYEEEERKRIEAEAANPPKPDEGIDASAEMMTDPQEEPPPPVPVPDTAEGTPEIPKQTIVIAGQSSNSTGELMGLLSSAFFGGRTVLPEAVGVAISFEADSYSVRSLLVNGPEAKGTAIPFVPQLISGPALVPESPSILPADTEFFVTLSLDYPLIYDGMVKALKQANINSMGPMRPALKEGPPEAPFAAYEKILGIKIKDDLVPLLGNEIALSIPVTTFDMGPPQPAPHGSPDASGEPGSKGSTELKPAEPSAPNPVIAISIKDKEGVRKLIPKIIESLGVKGANMLAQTEKRDDTELVSYAGAISYAFIGNFLLISPDTKALRHVVDSYLAHETLGADSHFRNYTRWQPRQVLGQVYVSPALMESYSSFARSMDSPFSSHLTNLLSRLSPTAEPITYALSNEGLGPLHELHIPKNLVLLMIAGVFGATDQSGPAVNELVARSTLRTIVSAEATYQATTGDGKYGSLEELVKQGLISKETIEKQGYRIELTVSGDSYEARAIPTEYGKTGKMSFFVDETAVIRGGDHGGGPATVSDKPVQ